jgi:hypothetical protein
LGVGERGVLKGCAAEVEVAGVVPVALRVIGVVEKARRSVEVWRGVGFNEALRRQERQIMMGVGLGGMDRGLVVEVVAIMDFFGTVGEM